MRYVVAMAAIPAAVWAAYPAPTPRLVPLKPAAIEIEGVRSVRLDTSTFRTRWLPVGDLAPAVMIQAVVEERTPDLPPVETVLPQLRRTKRAALHLDLCQRHGMHRVNYGRRWRCRR
jgi:hypothetical protein